MYAISQNQTVRIANITNADDREYYSDILVRHHYLESSELNRNTIVHVAKRGQEVVAIVTWEHRQQSWFSLRDRLVGWTNEQRDSRLKYVVENRRFLMLSKEPNLASSVLAQSLSRLDEDAERKLGHRFLLAETFVDPSQGYTGTCYKAAGWTEVGLTSGGRGRDTRSRKLYFIKELKKDAVAKLRAPDFSVSDITNPRQSVLSLERINIKSLKKQLESVPEYRRRASQYYPLPALLALLLTGVLCGNTRVSDIYRWTGSLSIEVIRSLGLRKHPSYKALWRPLRNVNQDSLSLALCAWLKEQTDAACTVTPSLKVLSLDGKALRAGSKAGGTEIHLLTLIDTIAKVVRAQVAVPTKTNEIPVARTLLLSETLDAATVVTADALHTQRETADLIQKKRLLPLCR